MNDATAHCDGLRATLTADADGTRHIGMSLVCRGNVISHLPLVTFAGDQRGVACASATLPLCEAIASFLTYGGNPTALSAIVAEIERAGLACQPSLEHIVTHIDAVRMHVLRRADDDSVIAITEDVGVEIVPAAAAARRVAESWYDNKMGEIKRVEDWSFLDEFRAE